jgi:hypothetical protein
MTVDALLSCLDRVRRTGPATWIGRCPAHRDRHPSLSIRETGDGIVLLHCFGGCSAVDVVAAVGLELSDLFPRQPANHCRTRERQPFFAADVLRCLRRELGVVLVVASDLRASRTVTDGDYARFLMAVEQIATGLELANA